MHFAIKFIPLPHATTICNEVKKLAFTYLSIYLAIGGIGFSFAPDMALKLFQSNAHYGEIMPRMAGLFMMALSYLIFRILRNQHWEYFLPTIQVRTGIVIFLTWLYTKTTDPLFLIVLGIVLLGLLPSVYAYFFTDKK